MTLHYYDAADPTTRRHQLSNTIIMLVEFRENEPDTCCTDKEKEVLEQFKTMAVPERQKAVQELRKEYNTMKSDSPRKSQLKRTHS